MKKVIFIILIVFAVLLTSCSKTTEIENNEISEPDIQWTRIFSVFSGIHDYHAHSVKQTKDGGYIIAGRVCDFGLESCDALLIKTDENGYEQWKITYGGEGGCNDDAYSVQQTPDGGYIFTGYKRVCQYPYFRSDIFLIRTNSFGNEMWNKTFGGGNGYDDIAYSVQWTMDGGYIVAGETGGDWYIIKTGFNGDAAWERTYQAAGFSSDAAKSIQQTTDGGYIIVGSNHCDIRIIKTNDFGDTLWTRTFSKPNYGSYGKSVQQTTDGGYIVAGNSGGAWIIKTDTNGNKMWEKLFGECENIFDDCYTVAEIQQTNDGGYIIVGHVSSDTWLIRTDANGNIVWKKLFIDYKYGTSVQQTKDGGYIVVGSGKDIVWLIKLNKEQ